MRVLLSEACSLPTSWYQDTDPKTGLVFSDVLSSCILKFSGDYYKMFIFIYITTASRFIPTTAHLQIDANIMFASKDLSRRRNLPPI